MHSWVPKKPTERKQNCHVLKGLYFIEKKTMFLIYLGNPPKSHSEQMYGPGLSKTKRSSS